MKQNKIIMDKCYSKHDCPCRPYICSIVDENMDIINCLDNAVCRFDGTVKKTNTNNIYVNRYFCDNKTNILKITCLVYSVLDKQSPFYTFEVEAKLSSYVTYISKETWCYSACEGWSLMNIHNNYDEVIANPAMIIQTLNKKIKNIKEK